MALQQIDAKMLSKMFLAGAKNLENKKEWINELNVFPVPDGDTGTNMTMTIMSAAREVSALGEDADMAALCKAIPVVPCVVPEVTPALSYPSCSVVSPRVSRKSRHWIFPY